MTGTRPQPQEVRLNDLAWRIRNEFAEMPGMHLTFQQVKRLWHLSQGECRMVLDSLLDAGLLARDEHDRFFRRESGAPRDRTAA